jgi:two-component system nitrogen regulation sensor histidine kinase GlnL
VSRDLQTVLDAVMDGVLLLDAGGRVEHINSEACRILESSTEAILRKTLERILGGGHPLVRLALRVTEEGQPAIQDDIELERRAGAKLNVDVSVSPLFDGADGIRSSGAVVVIRDRTISNSLREFVTQQEQLESYGLIAAGIAHEVKNPLGGIRGAAELIERWSGSDRATQAAQMIVREVDRISDLVEELMVFARGDELALEEVNLHWVLDGVIDLARMDAVSKGSKIERVYDPSIPEILADADRLKQVFLNLVRNAMQAMENKSGLLRVETRMTLDERLTGRGGHTRPTVQILFRDSGDGISPEILDHLATPFFTTRAKGTGLGLAVSRQWISRHHGTMQITSPPGEGTVVRVNLPMETLDHHATK